MYDALTVFLHVVVRVFFRSIEVSGRENVPRTGPVIFVGNHPNSLLDPVLVTVMCGRRVRFAAKETLFASLPLRPFLWVMGSVSVKRRQDQVDGAKEDDATSRDATPARVDNNAAFDALFAVLEQGAAFGIFPEGISHTRSQLAPLKTGAARIALGAAQKGIAVRIVPVGLTYKRRDKMRSRVLVQLGEPLVVDDDWVTRHQADPADAARALTADIGWSLRALTINAPDFEVLRVLDGVRKLYTPKTKKLTLAQNAELARRFLGGYEQHKSDAEVQKLYSDVERFQATMRSLGLSDRELGGHVSGFNRAGKIARHLAFMFVLVPLSIPGAILHLPVLATAVLAGATLTQRGDVRATVKVCVATALTLVSYLLAALALLWWFGVPQGLVAAAFAIVVLPISGWATIRMLERQAEIHRAINTLLGLFNLDREIDQVTALRDALRSRLLALVDAHIGTAARIIERADQKDAHPWLDDDDEE